MGDKRAAARQGGANHRRGEDDTWAAAHLRGVDGGTDVMTGGGDDRDDRADGDGCDGGDVKGGGGVVSTWNHKSNILTLLLGRRGYP